MKKLLTLITVAIFSLFIYACTEVASDLTGDDATTSTEAVSEIDSIDDIPLEILDPSNFIVTLNNSDSSYFKSQVPGEEGGFSRAGCEADQAVNRIVRNFQFPEVILCYLQKMGDALGMEFGEDDYNYYNLGDVPGGPDETGGSMSMKMAVKKVDDTLTMLMCENDVKVMEFEITADVENSLYEGHVIDSWTFDIDGVEASEQRSLNFNADGDADNFTESEFSESYVSDIWGYGSETLTATPDYAIVTGSNVNTHEGQDFSAAIYSKLNSTAGTAKFDVTGTYPAMNVGEIGVWEPDWYSYLINELGLTDEDYICCQEEGCSAVEDGENCEFTDVDTEAFSITGTAPDLNYLVVADDAGEYFTEVDAQEVSLEAQPTIEFSNSDFSDCAPPEGSEWSTLSADEITEELVAECAEKDEEMNDFQDENTCETLEQAARNE